MIKIKRKSIKKTTYMLLIVLISGLMGCGYPKTGSGTSSPVIFGATYMTRNNSYFDALHEAIEEVVESNGDILISRNPCQDQEKQNGQILEMIDEGIEVLFLNPVDWEKVKPALEACKKAGVIVIDVDTVVKDREYVVSIVETDNYLAGKLCAEDMMSRIPSGKIVIIDNPIQTSITNRVNGFLDAIDGNENYEVIYTDAGAGELEVSAKIIPSLLQQDIEFNVILGGNDPSALGALASLQQYGMDKGVLVYGIDGSPDFKRMLELGYVTGTAGQSPKTIGTVAAKTAYEYLAGKEVKEYISITPFMITKENLAMYDTNDWQ